MLIVVYVLLSVTTCFADTTISDDIVVDTIWGSNESVYVIDRNISVADTSTLTILPGVTILMDEGVAITVKGTLAAQGIPESTIRVTGKTITSHVLAPPPEPAEGEVLSEEVEPVYIDEVTTLLPKGFVFEPGSRGVLSYISIDHATDPIEGIDASIAIDNAILADAITGIHLTGGVLSVLNTLFMSIVVPAKIGLSVDFSHDNNTFTDTQYPGWNFFGDGYNQDVHLVAGDGVYILSSSLSIAAEHSITIDPGATLLLANNVSVNVYGKLTAQGTADEPIAIAPLLPTMRSSVFVMSDDPIVFEHVNYSLGEELFFAQTNHITIAHSTFVKSPVAGFASTARISDTTFSDLPNDAALSFWGNAKVEGDHITIHTVDTGIEIFNESSLVLSNADVTDTYNGIQIFGASTAAISHSHITQSENTGIAIYNTEMLASKITVSYSEIAHTDYGMFITYQKPGDIAVARTSFHDNTVAVFVTESTVIDLSNNWWGSDTGPRIDANPGGVGDEVDGPITVTPWLKSDPVLGNDPVIIVPGINGTRLLEGDEEVWPRQLSLLLSPFDTYLNSLKLLVTGEVDPAHNIAVGDIIRDVPGSDIFQGLITELIKNGYQEGVDLFVLPYDWRLSNTVNAPLLKARIDEALRKSGKEKVDIVAHSMGGVLAKEYIATFGKGSVDQLIFVGTPHLGAPKAYKALMYGDDMGITKFGISLLSQQRIKSISQNMSSMFELLPSQQYVAQHGSYVKDEVGDYVASDRTDRWLNYDETKDFMARQGRNTALFPVAEDVHMRTDNIDLSDIRTTNIVGCGTGALSSISMTRGWSFKPLGIPLVNDIDIGYAIGDGTVPVASAKLDTSDSQYFSTVGTHGSLPSIPQIREGIVALLIGRHPVVSHEFSTNGRNCIEGGTIIGIHSPVTLDIYDEDWRHAGPDAAGVLEEHIPGVTYDMFGDKKFAFLPMGATYRVVNHAEGLGEYDMSVVHVDGDGSVYDAQYFVDIPITSMTQSAETVVDTTSGEEYIMHIDEDVDGSSDHEHVSIATPPITQVQQLAADSTRSTGTNTHGTSVIREDASPEVQKVVLNASSKDVLVVQNEHEAPADVVVSTTEMIHEDEQSLAAASTYGVVAKSHRLVLLAILTIVIGFGIRKVFMR